MPRIVDHDLKRQELLDAALGLFAQEGFHALSVRRLARGLGVSTGTLYHYFDSKEALFEALVRRHVREHIEWVLAGLGPTEDRAQVEREVTFAGIERLMQMVEDRGEQLQQLLVVALDAQRSEPQVQALLVELLESYRAALEAHLGLPPATARLLLSAIFGVLVQRVVHAEGADTVGQLAVLRGLMAGL